MLEDKMKEENIDKLIPYQNNPKQHPQKQIDKIASSIKKFGFKVPMLVTEDNEIIAGHGRLKAARKLDIEKVPVIVVDDLSKAQVKAFRLADNRVAESDWNADKLAVELEELEEMDFDLEETGFEEEEINQIGEIEIEEESKYTDKIETPTYEPTGPKPNIEELLDKEKFKELIEKINEADIGEDKKEFLKLTAYRHIIFNYENIAEYYAHESKEVQELMEELTLVIIDFNKAIDQGFVDFAKNTLEGVSSEG